MLKRKVLKCSGTFSLGFSSCMSSGLVCQISESDVIYIHWINGFLSISDIEIILKLNKPTIFVMHDMWLLTGGCHYSLYCNEWQDRCWNCPIVANKKANNMVRFFFQKKHSVFNKYSNYTIITPSRWLSNITIKNSIFSKTNVYTLPNYLNTDTFQPIDKICARKILGLPDSKKLIMFGADCGSQNPYKGWNDFVKVIQMFGSNEIEIVVMGHSDTDTILQKKYNVHAMGQISDEPTLSLLYNAVDVFASPTFAESFGLTLLESISCGTPAVAYGVGGTFDVITHLQNGYLAKYRDISDFYTGVIWALEFSSKNRINIHNNIEEKFSYHQAYIQHSSLWKEINQER